MSERHQYSYVILRYVHDVLTSEFINVGVVMYVPSHGRIIARTRNTIGRLRGVFPDLERHAFTSMMANLRREFHKVARRKFKTPLFNWEETLASIVRETVPHDDSSLQWSALSAGITDNPQGTFESIYERFVARYDTSAKHRRTDDDVWRPVLQKLEERNLANSLTEKVIAGSLDDVRFKHAWKNGQWNVYEPISFDLADEDGIKRKAREWLGHLTAVVDKNSTEPFKAHFLIGAPSNGHLIEAFHTAKEILRRAPNEPQIFEEDQVDELVSQIEDEIRAMDHSAGAHPT
jgi:hypothetical protein